ncbi:ABC transporter ATP-binding protein [Paenibacillus nasutitermitis]|uniref:Multidrug ABC transporter ATP-binding protein n=1 Tax=Paenibacillus nasutitermitis TaxID=1652958 RepID=A0A916YXV2_9BACL|nr:ABC transporter ATP-binding protein [Paenibacillus nasutitermitis]GGD66179.1 multidrug ABC transporter ATP-binding protein [Paenibacillus nasutitermitis]
MQTAIELSQVSKHYGSHPAVDHITLNIGKGEVFGIVGPNGAGKTTLIEMIEGLRTADSGDIKVLGLDVHKHGKAIKQRIGVLLQSTSIPEKARVGEVLDLFASFYPKPMNREELSRFLNLEDKMRATVKSLSGGWKQRVSLALALINNPDIVFLDEPSMGLDPNARGEMWAMIHRMKEEGRTIVVTTHYMEEAQTLCDRVAIINQGRLIAVDTPRKLIAKLGGTRSVSFRHTDQTTKADLSALAHVVDLVWGSDMIRLNSNDVDETLKELFQLAAGQGWTVKDLRLEDGSMNDVFSQLTDHGKKVSE